MKRQLTSSITIALLFLFTAKAFAGEGLKLDASYIITLRDSVDESSIRIAEIETYIENIGDREVRVLTMSRESELKSSNRYFVYSAGIGKRKDGKVIKPPETAFNPVNLRPGEVARLPMLRVVLVDNEDALNNFRIYYRISTEAGAALGVWCGELECVPVRDSSIRADR